MSTNKPTIDWGYPTPADGPIPAFSNVDEEAEFWDTHGFTESGDIELLSVEEVAGLDEANRGDSRTESHPLDAEQAP